MPDRRIAKTEASIMTSFQKLLQTTDLDHLTITMLCTEANIGRKTFYLHYADKYALMDQLINQHLATLFEVCNDSGLLTYADQVRAWVAYFQEHRAFFAQMFRSHQSPLLRQRLAAATKDSLLRRDQGLKATTVSFVCYGVIGLMEELVLSDRLAKEVVAKDLLELLRQVLPKEVVES